MQNVEVVNFRPLSTTLLDVSKLAPSGIAKLVLTGAQKVELPIVSWTRYTVDVPVGASAPQRFIRPSPADPHLAEIAVR